MIKYIRNESGQILALVFISLFVVLFIVLFVVGGAQVYYQNASYTKNSEAALALAEAGVDKALASLNATGGTYAGDSETSVGGGTYEVIVTSKDASTKIIEATGYIPNKEKPKSKKTIKIQSSRGVGIAFNYGIQVGEGGLELGNINIITGSIYSNGNITAGNSNIVTGGIWVAGGPQPTADQETDCEGSNCDPNGFIFGKSVSGNDQLDVAQSFQPATSGILNKVSIKVKKTGNLPNVTVRVLQDSDGEPDKNAVLTTGTLYSTLVTDSYAWVDITFNTSPAVAADTIYWLMLDTSNDANNYWSWQNDLAQSYIRGEPKWSPNWAVGNATWNTFSPLGDLSFKDFLGGAPTSVRGGNNKMEVGGEVHANTIENLKISKDAYYQTIINSEVIGASYPGTADPPPKVFPISEGNITEWQDQADGDGSNTTGPINDCVTTLGPVKVLGDVTFNSGCRVTIKSPIWITGNLTMNSNNILTLDSSWNTTSGVIVVDGKIDFNTNNHLNGTGKGISLLMALSNYDSRSDDITAVKFNSNGNTGVFYAHKGIVAPGTGNNFKELTAWKIKLVNSSTIDYETGLSSTLFTSGPSGAYSLIGGTYQVK